MVVSLCARRIILSRTNFLKVPKRNGYIVLLPEIGDDLPDKNPLMKEDKFPEFNNITIEKCIAAIGKQTVEFEEGIKMLEKKLKEKGKADIFNDVLNPLEEMFIALEVTWGIAKTLYFGNQSVMPTKCYLGIHDRAKRACASKYVSTPIYQECKSFTNNKDNKLTDEQKRILLRFIFEGKTNGLELSDEKRNEYLHFCMMTTQKISGYKERLEAATKMFSHTIKNPEIVKDFAPEFLKTIAVDPRQAEAGPWVATLKPSVFKTVMEYCPNRPLRWKLWEADVTKSSLFQDKLYQTSTLLEEIRANRDKTSKLLGYKSFMEMSMETKMAGSIENLRSVMDTLLETARPAQEQEIHQLTEFANERGHDGAIQAWDIAYWSRKQQRSVYKYDENNFKDYFPLPKVLSGMFKLIETLFGVKMVENKKVDIWHKDVRVFDVFDINTSSAEPTANFYLDPYARGEEKMRLELDSGWMVAIRNKSKICASTPLAACIFNFQPPTDDRPSLLSFRDVRTLFQKFGHLLQHILTTVNYAEIAGFSFVEWDAVFISDYFLLNWLYEPSVLRQISGHYDSGEPLSEEMIESLRKVRTHFAGYNLCRELYLSHMDLELHSSGEYWATIMDRTWNKYLAIPQNKKDSHVCSFDAIFSGPWAGAYYSYIWSEMIAADVFSALEELPTQGDQQQKEIGKRYRETFLSLGGSYTANEVFRKFRGRDPSPKALLDNLGLYNRQSAPT